jgi:hypothetical protein
MLGLNPKAWYGLAGAALLFCSIFLAAVLASNPHPWTGNLAISAYSLGGLAAVLARLGLATEKRSERPAAPPAEPEFPIFPGSLTDDDNRSEMRQALGLHPTGDLREALDAVGFSRRRRRWDYCERCGFPFSTPSTRPGATTALNARSGS